MKLVNLRIGGFGALQGEWTFAPDRVNVVLDDNERGKSSLLAAGVAALYGLDADRRSHRVVTPLERWRPWNGGAYRVALDLECASGPYTIARDFEAGHVSVFDRTGREVTASFLEGRDEYPIGKKLLGLDRVEFEKCAWLIQGELDGVVPGDEKARRASTLKSRLENAADTHIGDTNASEALKVLDRALRQYEVVELGFTGTVDNAIVRLEAKLASAEVERRELDARLLHAQSPLEELHHLAEQEQSLQERVRALESERRAGHAADLRRQLQDQDEALAEVARLEAEAASLAESASLSPNAEGELRDTIARHEEAVRGVEALESRRREEIDREREAIDRERRELAPYDGFTSEDADRCVAHASELRQLLMQDALLRHQVFELRDALAAQGYVPEQIQELQQRFGALPAESVQLLRQQAELNAQFQGEALQHERQRSEATETLREIESERTARRNPGLVLLVLGVTTMVGGVTAQLVLEGMRVVGLGLVGGGFVAAAVGALLVGLGAGHRRDEHEEAYEALMTAQSRVNELHSRRMRNEAGLAELAGIMGYRDSVELLHQFSQYVRLADDAGPLLRAQEQLAVNDGRRQQVFEQTRPLLALTGATTVSPELLDRIAQDARRSLAARQRFADLERGFGWVEEERRSLEATALAMHEKAVRLVESAGITFEAALGWPHHVAELKRRVDGRVRHAMVADELIPAARRRLQPEAEIASRRRQLEMLLVSGELPETSRTSGEIDGDLQDTRARLDDTRRRRADLRVEVEELWRNHAQRSPEVDLERDRFGLALERARLFKAAVQRAHEAIERVATDTHRKWADFLNDRVAAILQSFGTSVGGLRFGEDLDFSVQMLSGPMVSRGKAHLQLSSGARDQLYLAVRLAIGEFLSRGGETLPLLADDVFATSDDERLRTGLRALIESAAAGHQVLYATCHRSRLENLQQSAPEWFRDRIHLLDLRTGSGTTAR
jgi:hypothetical protein